MNQLADRVRSERLGRRMSVREAAQAGGISNTWWARFEDGTQPLTAGIVTAVAKAFAWPEDWASQPGDEVAVLRADLEELRGRVEELAFQLGELMELASVRLEGGAAQPPPAAGDVPGASDSG